MSKIVIKRINDVDIKIQCDADVAYELNDYFTFNVPNAKFSPKFKNKMWDGKIRLFNILTKRIYCGLKLYIEIFARERNYTVEYETPADFLDTEFSLVEAKETAAKYIGNTSYTVRDYQAEAFAHAIRTKRALLLSPTGSGKSLIIYLLASHCYQKGKKVLIIVPTTSLVHQLASDFEDYSGIEANTFVHRILSGAEKSTDHPFVISTWQSIYKMPQAWFEQFNCVIGDEAHTFKAKSLIDIMTKLVNCPFKFGTTGTLDGTTTNKLVLEGLFGPVKKVTTTAELIDTGTLSQMKIKAIVLSHSDEARKAAAKMDYAGEIDYIINHASRNKFLVNLCLSLKGNTLILFRRKEHGYALRDMLKEKAGDRQVYHVDGDIDVEYREDVRKEIESLNDGIIVASIGTFSTGINIRNLHNVVFASPSKARIKVLQSIGRGLRKSETKSSFTLYDVADDMSWKSRKNFTILHFAERIQMYSSEKFDYKFYNVELRS